MIKHMICIRRSQIQSLALSGRLEKVSIWNPGNTVFVSIDYTNLNRPVVHRLCTLPLAGETQHLPAAASPSITLILHSCPLFLTLTTSSIPCFSLCWLLSIHYTVSLLSHNFQRSSAWDPANEIAPARFSLSVWLWGPLGTFKFLHRLERQQSCCPAHLPGCTLSM